MEEKRGTRKENERKTGLDEQPGRQWASGLWSEMRDGNGGKGGKWFSCGIISSSKDDDDEGEEGAEQRIKYGNEWLRSASEVGPVFTWNLFADAPGRQSHPLLLFPTTILPISTQHPDCFLCSSTSGRTDPLLVHDRATGRQAANGRTGCSSSNQLSTPHPRPSS
jgi:hypothetical protein